MTNIEFENEQTWLKASKSGQTEEVHNRYDAAVNKVSDKFGIHYPHFIDGKKLFSEYEFEDRSPNDIRLILGTFQIGTKNETEQAIEAASRAFKQWSQTSNQSRIKIVRRAADIIVERKLSLQLG